MTSRRLPLDLRTLAGDQAIFRLSGATARDASVDTWFAQGPAELRAIAHEWFELMRRCGGDVRELLHDGCPVACVQDAPFGYVNTFKSHLNVGFFQGAFLHDPAGLLDGSGKRMRHVKITADGAVNAAALRELISAAYADIKARLEKA